MRRNYFQHAEELVGLWPDIQRDDIRAPRKSGVQPWWRAPGRHSSHGGNVGPGHGVFFLQSPRNQQVLVKGKVTKNWSPTTWGKSGGYLQRRGAQQPGQIGRGFDAEHEKIDIKSLLSGWQRAGDPHLFKIILSPEHGKELDLKTFTRRVVREMERDLKQPLQWVAIDHHNTKTAHIHLVIRGLSREHTLTIARSYLSGGLKQRAQEVATHMLGPRTRREIEQFSERMIDRRAWSHLDQSIKAKMSKDQLIATSQLTPVEQQRLEHLEARDLAWREGDQWRMSIEWEAKSMNEQTPQRKPQEQEQTTPAPVEQQKGEQEQELDEQHRRAVVVDDLEQDLGWGR